MSAKQKRIIITFIILLNCWLLVCWRNKKQSDPPLLVKLSLLDKSQLQSAKADHNSLSSNRLLSS